MGHFLDYFSSADFMPHGHCYLWRPPLVWTMVITDGLIGLAYLSISVSLYRLVRKIQLPFSAMFVAFGLFIFACGATHFMEIYNLWVPNYWLSAFIKSVTAIASVATALLMFPLQPKISMLATSVKLSEQRRLDLETAKNELESKVEERTRELKLAVDAREEFLSIASHELRTPLTPLKLQIQMAQRALAKSKELPSERLPLDLESALDVSLRQVNRLTTLVETLLDVSRIQAGNFICQKTEVDLSAMVTEIISRFSSALSTGGYTIKQNLSPNVFGFWDRIRIDQAVTNLISNAIKYGSANPIEISVTREENFAVFSIEDHGIGIAPENLSRIFERFERAVSHMNISGLGLGLFIVKKIAKAHGGDVEAQSELGIGSKFRILLPLLPEGTPQ